MNHDKTMTVLGVIAGLLAAFGEALTNIIQSNPTGVHLRPRDIMLGVFLYLMGKYGKGIDIIKKKEE